MSMLDIAVLGMLGLSYFEERLIYRVLPYADIPEWAFSAYISDVCKQYDAPLGMQGDLERGAELLGLLKGKVGS